MPVSNESKKMHEFLIGGKGHLQFKAEHVLSSLLLDAASHGKKSKQQHKKLDEDEIVTKLEVILDSYDEDIDNELNYSLRGFSSMLGVFDIFSDDYDDETEELLFRIFDQINNLVGEKVNSDVFVPPTKEDLSCLWVNRAKEHKQTPVDFIEEVYAEWLGKGLTRAHLKVDKGLYMALKNWLRSKENKTSEELAKLDKKMPKANKKYANDTKVTASDLAGWRKVQAMKMREVYSKR